MGRTNKSGTKLFVAVEMYQGLVHDVRTFTNSKSADEAEEKWVTEHDIKDDISRECKAADGTEFHIFECPLEG